jgi:hypothetical protein
VNTSMEHADRVRSTYTTRAKKPLAIALSGAGRRSRGRDDGGDLTNVQHKPVWNCHNESPWTMNIS